MIKLYEYLINKQTKQAKSKEKCLVLRLSHNYKGNKPDHHVIPFIMEVDSINDKNIIVNITKEYLQDIRNEEEKDLVVHNNQLEFEIPYPNTGVAKVCDGTIMATHPKASYVHFHYTLLLKDKAEDLLINNVLHPRTKAFYIDAAERNYSLLNKIFTKKEKSQKLLDALISNTDVLKP